jgi:hypothetical protein
MADHASGDDSVTGRNEHLGAQRHPVEAQRLHHRAERVVGGVELGVHRGGQAAGAVPVVGVGEHVGAAGQRHAPVADRLARRGVQQPANLGARGLFGARRPLGDDLRRIGEMARRAPALQRLGGAVVGQQVGVEFGDQGA